MIDPPTRFQLLGPVQIRFGDVRIPLGTPKQRAVAAVLIAQRGDPVSPIDLIDELWPDTPPRSAAQNVRTYVSRLRRALPVVERSRVGHRLSGYVLCSDPGEVDVDVFRARAAAGRAELAAGAPAAALASLDAALAVWQGRPVEDVRPGPLMASIASRIAEERLDAREDRALALARTGETGAAVAALREITARHPMRERSWSLLVAALSVHGDVAQGLNCFRVACDTLQAELGVAPGPALTAVHQAILAGTPTGAEVVGTPSSRSGAWSTTAGPTPLDGQAARRDSDPPRPRQLPAPTTVRGRDRELAALHTALSADRPRPPGTGPRLVVVAGAAGSGASTLAALAAHRVAADYPDGQLYADLRQCDGAGAPVVLLHRFLRAFGAPQPDTQDESAAELRSVLACRRALILLDHAEHAELVRTVLPAESGCAVVVTSRAPLSLLDATTTVVLCPLDAASSWAMLAELVGPCLVGQDPTAITELLRRCGGRPAELRRVAARFLHQPDRDLARLLDQPEP